MQRLDRQRWIRAFATVGGLGYLPKAPGTAGSLAGWIVGLLTAHQFLALPAPWRFGILLWDLTFGFLFGVAISEAASQDAGIPDPSFVVIDEWVGMWTVMIVFPSLSGSLLWSAIAFGLFRLFDITKPPPLKWLSRFPGGWGIMLDDLGASGYTVLLLWLIFLFVQL